MMKAAASGTREKMTAGAAGNKNEVTAAGTKGGMAAGAAGARKMIKAAAAKIIEILNAAAGGTTKTCQQELQEAEN